MRSGEEERRGRRAATKIQKASRCWLKLEIVWPFFRREKAMQKETDDQIREKKQTKSSLYRGKIKLLERTYLKHFLLYIPLGRSGNAAPWAWSSDFYPAQDFKDINKGTTGAGVSLQPRPLLWPSPSLWSCLFLSVIERPRVITGKSIKKPLEYGFIYLL